MTSVLKAVPDEKVGEFTIPVFWKKSEDGREFVKLYNDESGPRIVLIEKDKSHIRETIERLHTLVGISSDSTWFM